MKYTEYMPFRVSPELRTMLETQARQEERSVSSVMRRTLNARFQPDNNIGEIVRQYVAGELDPKEAMDRIVTALI